MVTLGTRETDRPVGDDGPCLMFDHIPKCGGTTLHTILRRHYRPEEAVFCLRNARSARAELERMPVEERRRFKLVHGHGVQALEALIPRPMIRITVLRRPEERLLSQYKHARRKAEHTSHQEAQRLTFDEFVRSPAGAAGALKYTSRFSGIPEEEAIRDPTHALTVAKRRADERFALVGVLERFDETVLLLRHLMRWWGIPFYRVENRAPTRSAAAAESREALQLACRFDQEFYDHAVRRFDAQVAERGPTFPAAVRAFSTANAGYRRARWAFGRLRGRRSA